MTSLVQFLLIVVISTLTFLIAIVAIQVFQILHEAKIAIKKFNQILENTHQLSVNQFISEAKAEASDRVIAKSSPTRRFFHRAGQMLRPTKPS